MVCGRRPPSRWSWSSTLGTARMIRSFSFMSCQMLQEGLRYYQRMRMLVVLFGMALSAIAAAQTQPPAASTRQAKPYSPPKTAWGEPDLRGTYTSDNSIGVPFERPQQYGERTMLTDAEFDAREKANQVQVAKDLAEKPESTFEEDEAANNAPRHWLERGTKLSHATSLVIDPPNGRLPGPTPAGPQAVARHLLSERPAERPPAGAHAGWAAARRAGPRALFPAERRRRVPQLLRPLHHARRGQLDPAGHLRQRHELTTPRVMQRS